MRLHRRSHFVMAAIAAIALLASASPALASPSDSGGGLVPFGTAPALPYGASMLGAVPSTENISFDVVLKPRNQAALDAFVQDVSTPGSPQYHKFLKKGEFGPRFGATQTSIAAVTRSLKSMGLTVGGVSSSGLVVNASGSAEKVGKALHTSFRQVRLESGRIARANVAAPRLPSTISPAVKSVIGLDTMLQLQHTPNRKLSTTARPMTAHQAQGLQPNTVTCSAKPAPDDPAYERWYTPGQLASYYGLNSLGTTGSGVTVAVYELEPFRASDTNYYRSCYPGAGTVTVKTVDGGAGFGAGKGESALDIEDIMGLAPNANILVYEAPNTGSGIVHEYQHIADDNLADIVSVSWGMCESTAAAGGLAAAERSIFQQMAAQGQTVLVASGDDGSAGCLRDNINPSTSLAVGDPASQPEVTAVGGTTLRISTNKEFTWNNGYDGSSANASGGGQSALWPMPSWQQGTGVLPGYSSKSCNGGTAYCREIPDVSASADGNHAYVLYWSGAWYTIGGTSAAAPTWASLLALIGESCGRLGLINPALYDAENDASAFRDIVDLDNDGLGTHGGRYPASAGYDMATGLGTPHASALNAHLCPAVDGTGSMSVSPSTVTASTNTTLTFTYTAPAGHALTDGTLSLTIPSGWSAPSTTPTAAGFTTASTGVVSASGQLVTISDVAITAGGTVTIKYGDISGSGPGAAVPAFGGPSTFAVKQAATSGGTLTALSAPPKVDVQGPAADGSGTMTVSPNTVAGSATSTLTFTYTPPTGATLTNGEIDIDVPADWTAPSTTSTAPGYISANIGGVSSPVTFSGTGPWTITASSVTLGVGDTLKIVYGDTSGGGGGATAPANTELSTFTAKQKASAGGTVKTLATSPQVQVQGPAADGSGTMTVSPKSVTTGSSNTLTFKYTPPANSTVTNGEVDVTIPADWTPPSTTPTDAGYVRAFGGTGTNTPSITGTGPWTIGISDVDLAVGQQLTIVYGDTSGGGAKATAPSSAETSIFNAAMGYSTPPTNLAVSPTVTVQSPPPPPSSGGSPVGHPTLLRVSGPDRIATSIAASKAAFPHDSSAHVVVLARSDSYADALAGTPLAAAKNGPLLLTLSTSLPDPVVGEIGRVLPIGGTIYILGGTAAINSSIQTELTGFGYNVQRLAGNSRYETAVAIAAALGNPSTVFEADGTNFPDALSAGSAAVHEGGVVLLTSGTTMPAATAAYLVAHPSTRYAIGGPAAKADPGAQKFVGADRYATSVLVAQKFFQAPISVGLASGQTFPDALSGGVVASLNTGPMILVPKSGNVPSGTLSYLTFAGNSASKAWLFGGTASVDDVVFLQAADALKPGSTTAVIG